MKKRVQTYHHLFVSLPVSYLDDANNEDEGMIGKILHASKMSHKEIKAEIKARFDENKESTDDNRASIQEAHA